WSCEVHALRWLFPKDLFLRSRASQPYLIVHVDKPGGLLGGRARLVGPDALSRRIASSKSIPFLLEATRLSPFQPWSEPGWLRSKSDWLTGHLGSNAVREIRQVRVNATGAVLKFTGRMGTLFLKALPSFLSYEARLLATLDKKLPSVCASLLQADP